VQETTVALGYDGRLFLLALEDPRQPIAGGAQVPEEVGDVAQVATVLLDAAEHAAAAAGRSPGELGVLVDAAFGEEVAADVRGRGLTLALPVDDRGEERFAFAHGDAFARHIEQLGPELSTVRVRWHPDDAPEVKKAQALGLTKLAAWLHETDRRLLVELLVPPTEDDLATVDGDLARYEAEVRGAHTRDAVREVRDLGIEPDVWSVAVAADAEEVRALSETIRDAGREGVAAVVRGLVPDDAEEVVRACATADAYRGAVFGPDLWSAELGALAAGARSREETVRAVGDRLAHLVAVHTAATSS
jgi:myo-inositol catabolism protein IolC